jgi:acid phosphatase family membrane protein YuiD
MQVNVNYVSDGSGDQASELNKLIAKLREENSVLRKSLLEGMHVDTSMCHSLTHCCLAWSD